MEDTSLLSPPNGIRAVKSVYGLLGERLRNRWKSLATNCSRIKRGKNLDCPHPDQCLILRLLGNRGGGRGIVTLESEKGIGANKQGEKGGETNSSQEVSSVKFGEEKRAVHRISEYRKARKTRECDTRL